MKPALTTNQVGLIMKSKLELKKTALERPLKRTLSYIYLIAICSLKETIHRVPQEYSSFFFV